MREWSDDAVTARFESLLQRVRKYRPEADEDLLQRAFEFAWDVHRPQLRQSGEPYILHPLAACEILADIEADEEALSACLLHDTVEDCMQDEERLIKLVRAEHAELLEAGRRGQADRLLTEIQAREQFVEKVKDEVEHNLAEQFGRTIARMVESVTKVSEVRFFDSSPPTADGTEDEAEARRRALQAETLRRMVVAAAQDVRVLMIKLADRLHNMQTLYAKRRPKQLSIARETQVLYVPLADRLGIWRIKWEMEDLVFRYLEPEQYFELERRVARTREERQAEIDAIVAELQTKLNAAGVKARCYGRPKHLYSLYQKMRRQGLDFDDVYDLEALRIITETVADCYAALGVLHGVYPFQPEKFYDYISQPKPNGYRSIHSKVIVPGQGPVEVQIRTAEMHREAEYGVAAHWRYKDEDGVVSEAFANKLTAMRQLFELARGETGGEGEETEDFLRAVEAQLANEEVFVYTPKGEAIALPRGACVVDFAYHIHTEVGHTCIGAKVNRRIVPLDYRLRNGDQVEILRQRNTGPSRDWLKIVVTASARNRIRQYWRRQERETLKERGQKQLEEEAARRKVDLNDLYRRDRELPATHRRRALDQPVEDVLTRVARRRSYNTAEDLLSGIGDGTVSAEGVLHQLEQDLDEAYRAAGLKPPEEYFKVSGRSAATTAVGGVSFQGIDNLVYKRSKCCLPLPGDVISGYITRGQGIAIHRSDCHNLRHLRTKEPDRVQDNLDWQYVESVLYDVPLEIRANDRMGLLRDLAGLMSELGINILSANTISPRLQSAGTDHIATVRLTLELVDRSQIEELVRRLPALGAVKIAIRGQTFLDADKGHVQRPAAARRADASRRR